MSDIRMAAQGGPGFGNDVFDRLLSERIIFLGSQVDDEIANKLCAQILLLSAEDPTRDISLYINSPGGSVTAGMAIYDTMKYSPCDIATYGMGLAFVEVSILKVALSMGLITFALSLVGAWIGHHGGGKFGKWATILGGIILIGIGANIVYEHLSA